MSPHEVHMRRAIKVARRNPKAPFGALLVDTTTDEVIVEGVNQSQQNPLLHGEIDAINKYAQLGVGNWTKLRLYSTAEPCCMCQAAILWAEIPEVVFGTSVLKLVSLGWHQFNLRATDVIDSAPFAKCKIIGDLLAEECDRLFETAKT